MLLSKTKRVVKFSTLSTLILLGFCSLAQAQLCGQYGVSLVVTNESGEAIRNVQIILTPEIKIGTETIVFKQDPGDAKLFRLILPEGNALPVKYKLHVEAPGFKRHSRKVKIVYCQRQELSVTLVEKQSSARRRKDRQ